MHLMAKYMIWAATGSVTDKEMQNEYVNFFLFFLLHVKS